MDREQLIERILQARSEQEIAEAEQLADSYLEQQPDDDGVRMALEQLEMIKMAPTP